MNNTKERDIVVAALKHAAPYIRMYKRKTFVIKAGGEAFDSPKSTHALLEQIAILHQVGIRVVLVHGGGPQATKLAKELGVPTTIIQGRRVTDEKALAVATRVNDEISSCILSACRDLDLAATIVSHAIDGPVRARKRSPMHVNGDEAEPVDFGYVGDIQAVDVEALQTGLEPGDLPIVGPLASDSSGTLLNINADTVAATLAAELNAEKLILATGAAGILDNPADPGSLVSYLDLKGLQAMRENGSLADGMLPKASAIEAAIQGGVARVHVISHSVPDSILLEVFTNEGTGTLVVDSIEKLSAAEQAPGQT
jgi:acetylglutamate kinase